MKASMIKALIFLLLSLSFLQADNQTAEISQIFGPEGVPYTVEVRQASFSLPVGLQAFAFGKHDGKWLLITGRMNGLHGFSNVGNNFPPDQENTFVFVVDPCRKMVFAKSLADPTSGLTQELIDTLSVTDAEFVQSNSTLYVVGGYGMDTASGEMTTKSTLTAIDISGLMHWVVHPSRKETARQHIRQISDPIFQIAGGELRKGDDDTYLLIFGQNFTGLYRSDSNGDYSQQIRRFRIIDNGFNLGVIVKDSFPEFPDPNFRRRDLNVVPVIFHHEGSRKRGYVAYSGVFTLSGGAWTVPVLINQHGEAKMPNPNKPNTFKQGMNNYCCPTVGLYSRAKQNMYTTFFGGISFGFWVNGTFQTDSRLPFINQFTTIQFDRHRKFTQYLMETTYPVILSTSSHPGNQLLFGANAVFIPVDDLPTFDNGVIKLDELSEKPTLIGYILGGIQSTLPETATMADSAASPYIFKVVLQPK